MPWASYSFCTYETARCRTIEPPIVPMESAILWAPSTSSDLSRRPASTAARTLSMVSFPEKGCEAAPIWPARVEASMPLSKASATVSGRLIASEPLPSSARSASVPT